MVAPNSFWLFYRIRSDRRHGLSITSVDKFAISVRVNSEVSSNYPTGSLLGFAAVQVLP